jgi:hypothetical protein
VRGYVVDVNFCVFDISIEEFGAGLGFGLGFRIGIGFRLGIVLVDVGYLDILNRDIKDTEVDIYNIASHKGLKGEIDTRLLTKNGRIQIAKDIKEIEILDISENYNYDTGPYIYPDEEFQYLTQLRSLYIDLHPIPVFGAGLRHLNCPGHV